MKKHLVALACATALAAGAVAAYAYHDFTPGSGVVGSPHDMSYVYPGSDGTYQGDDYLNQQRICAFCHTPHHALDVSALTDYAPLWSREISNLTYTPYDSWTFDGKTSSVNDNMQGASRLCMSCHDGTVAADQHYGRTWTNNFLAGDNFGEFAIAEGSSLSNDHPIGFNFYEVSMSAGTSALDHNGNVYYGIYPLTKEYDLTINPSGGYTDSVAGAVAAVDTVVGGSATITRTIQDLMYIPLAAAGDVQASVMTCASCHDVHNKEVAAGQRFFLVQTNEDSALCLVCHNK